MPVQPSYPGVYVQEVPSGVRTIVGVSTSIALFIGRAKWGPVNEPVQCLNYTDFERNFTADTSLGDLPRAVKLFFLNGGTQCYVVRIAFKDTSASSEDYATASTNTGGTLTATAKHPGTIGNSIRFKVQHTPDNTFKLTVFRLAPDGTSEIDEQTWEKVSMDVANSRFVEKYVNYRWATFSLTDPTITTLPSETPDPHVLSGGLEGMSPGASQYESAYEIVRKKVDLFNLLVLPANRNVSNADTDNTDKVDRADFWAPASVFCEEKRAFLIMDPPETWNDDDVSTFTGDLTILRNGLVNSHSALYFPNLVIREDEQPINVDPSGAIAGLMARIDTNRGVWKAPAGVEAALRGVRGLQYQLSDRQNGTLNPQGLNIIRVFPNGIVSWGARTMDGDDDFASEWKYIPVRRTALFIEESLYRGMKWVVFEPNDERLWAQIRLNVGAFMHNLFVQGAFQGIQKSEAYFVKCDSETTTQNDINLGIVNVWVGFAPLKPAEFVILHLQQMTGQVQV